MAASTRARVAATIASSRSGVALMREPRAIRDGNQPLQHLLRRAAVDGRRRPGDAVLDSIRDTATNSAAPAFKSTTSRARPCSPLNTERTIFALVGASPPFNASGVALTRPKSADGRRTSARPARGTPTPWYSRWSITRRGRPRRARPTRARPEQRERPRQQFRQFGPRHADDLPRRARRVGERSEQVERGAHTEVLARLRRVLHRRMERRRKQNARPTSFRHAAASVAPAWMFTPSASSTSALPH